LKWAVIKSDSLGAEETVTDMYVCKYVCMYWCTFKIICS